MGNQIVYLSDGPSNQRNRFHGNPTMVDIATAALFIIAIGASFFAAWTIGAGSSGSTPFAPAVGAHAMTTMQAAFVVGLLALAGAVLQGAAITETIGEGLIEGPSLSPVAAVLALLIASTYIAVGVFRGYPIATAFAITGSIVGVGLAMGGDPAWGTYTELIAYWILTPVVVAPPVYVLTKMLRGERFSQRSMLTMLGGAVGLVIANMEFLFLGEDGEEASLAATIGGYIPLDPAISLIVVTGFIGVVCGGLAYKDSTRDKTGAQRRFLLVLGALVAFTAGAGKVGLAVGPLLPLMGEAPVTITITHVLIFGGLGMLLGTWMASPRMIKALTQDYSMLGPRRSIAILIPSFVIAQVGVFLGLPMSFNQIFISAIAATGYAVGAKTVSERKLVITAAAWVGSIIFGLAVGFGAYTAYDVITTLL